MSATKIHGVEYDLDARDQFVICEGRYFSCMFFVELPGPISAFQQGGDVDGMVWRKNEEPEHWIMQFRFRHYRDKQAWNSKDTKRWYWVDLKDHAKTEEEAREQARKLVDVLQVSAKVFGIEKLKVDWFEMHGDCSKAFELLQKNPPYWMHRQQVVAE